MSLLTIKYFDHVFLPMHGEKIGFLPMDGNVGDLLIDEACIQLFKYYNIDYQQLTHEKILNFDSLNTIDRIVISGGGNLGSFYQRNYKLRESARSYDLPITILPQSFTDLNEDISGYSQVYVREVVSYRLHPLTKLAPDLALAYQTDIKTPSIQMARGVFLRTDKEGLFTENEKSLGDPVTMCETVEQYLSLASQYSEIVTDRLHFGIAGLIMNCDVTLLPNSYFKNQSMHQTWLKWLGCRWQNSI